jgi:uncharacterized cupin superfamily protein
MNKLVVFGVTALIILLASGGVVLAQKESSKNKNNVIYVAAEKATFNQSPTAGVSMAVLWGDPNKGPHGTFTKFEPGYDAGMHTHTSDVWIVVIKGAYLYKDDEGEKRVGPGGLSESREATSIGAAGTKRKAHCFIRKGRGNSISYQRSKSGHG